MKIQMNQCKYCGGKGKLHDFDHSYSPNGKSVKFLETGYGLSTFAECQKCSRSTESFKTPFEAIMAWNDG